MGAPSRQEIVAQHERARPSTLEAWLEADSPGYQYGYVLLLLAMTFVVMAAGPPDAWTRVTTVLLRGLTLLAALLASRVSRRLFRIAALVSLLSLLFALGSVVSSSSRDPSSAFFPLNVLLVATVPLVIARSLWRRRIIDGMSSDPFFVQTSHATTPDFLYFSYITQTTVGFGDLTHGATSGGRCRCSRRWADSSTS